MLASPTMWLNTIHVLRVVGLIEGISFLVLLGIAMPLKYLAEIDAAVKVAGWAHGILFIVFCALLAAAMFIAGWTIRRSALVFFAALIPFGPFLIDGRLKRYDQAFRSQATAN